MQNILRLVQILYLICFSLQKFWHFSGLIRLKKSLNDITFFWQFVFNGLPSYKSEICCREACKLLALMWRWERMVFYQFVQKKRRNSASFPSCFPSNLRLNTASLSRKALVAFRDLANALSGLQISAVKENIYWLHSHFDEYKQRTHSISQNQSSVCFNRLSWVTASCRR